MGDASPVVAQDTALIGATPLPADRHPAAVYLASLAPGSRRTMCHALDVVAGVLTGGQATAETLAWAAVRYQHTQAVRAALAVRYAPATANKTLAALRGVLRETWRLGYVSAEEYHRAADLPAIRGSALPRGRALTPGELRALFSVVAEDARPATRARDAALLAVLYGAGVRRAEAVALDVADYEPDSGALTIRRGKGNKARVVYTTYGASEALGAWLAVRGLESGALFVPVDKAGRIVLRRLTPESVFDRLQALARRAAVARFSPHDMRRSFISDLLDNGADLAVVQAMAGHANPATTARYDRRGERAKQRAAGLLVVPYAAG
jgi:site-specific recombinase XerD